MRNKLRDNRGETLMEVLASILICTLSISLLFGAIVTSSDIDGRTQELDEQYYQDLTRAERQEDAAGTDWKDVYPNVPSVITVKVKNAVNNNERTLTVNGTTSGKVKFYGTDRLLSYAFSEATGP